MGSMSRGKVQSSFQTRTNRQAHEACFERRKEHHIRGWKIHHVACWAQPREESGKAPELEEARDEQLARDIGWCLVHQGTQGYKHTRTRHLSSQAAPSSANGYIV